LKPTLLAESIFRSFDREYSIPTYLARRGLHSLTTSVPWQNTCDHFWRFQNLV
jgi:hypothetical protein